MSHRPPDDRTPFDGADVAVVSDIGAGRERNEDAALVPGVILGGTPRSAFNGAVRPGPGSVVAVFDGLGGHAAGSVASVTAAAVLNELAASAAAVYADCAVEPGDDWLDWAVRACADRVAAIGELDDATYLMGTTIAGLLLERHTVDVFHVGDSRVYLFDGAQLVLLTRDHRTEADGRLTQVLGGTGTSGSVVPGLVTLDRRMPVRYVLCSDGLTDTLDAVTIRALVAGGTPAEAAERLVGAAVRAPSQDNVTVMVVDVPAAEEAS